METPLIWWVAFNAFVLVMLALDLGVFHRRSHEVGFKEALGWSFLWIGLALLFNLGIYLGWFGAYPAADRPRVALEFLTGYLIEKALSVDNIFVFALIFAYFAVPPAYQHKVLFYGILGALLFRAAFIFGGLWLIEKFAWTMYIFAVLLIITGVKMALAKGKEIHPERNPVLRLVRSAVPIGDRYVADKFLTRLDGKWSATPLLLVLVLVETTDVIFAVDSIPAILAITTDSFIVYTSNVFAILGLRALYFALAGFMRMFRYLSLGLAVLLVFIGGKMLAHAALGFKLPVGVSLAIIAVVLAVAVLASLRRTAPHAPPAEARP